MQTFGVKIIFIVHVFLYCFHLCISLDHTYGRGCQPATGCQEVGTGTSHDSPSTYHNVILPPQGRTAAQKTRREETHETSLCLQSHIYIHFLCQSLDHAHKVKDRGETRKASRTQVSV